MTDADVPVPSRTALYDGFAVVGKALSAGRRLEILDLLSQGPRSVGQLADETGQTMANTSQHLQLLVGAGLVSAHRVHRRVTYQLSRPEVAALLSTLRDLAFDQVDHVRDLAMNHLGDRADLDRVSHRELVRRMRAGEVVVIDVRSRHEFDAGHIPGALCLTPDELADFARQVPADSQVVVYCRGEYCNLADTAIRELRHLGIHAQRLEEGFPEWQRAGHPADLTKA